MKNSITDRMKENYERVSDLYLTRRMPAIIRVDGKSFHTVTKEFKLPYDNTFHNIMNKTMISMCKEIQNVVFGYTQSDEISLLLMDYKSLESEQWFGGRIQKMCSISAGLATYFFGKYYLEICELLEKVAVFDSRIFSIPEAEVVNYFIGRQQDATRNAIQSLGQYHLGKKKIRRMNNNQVQDMVFKEKGINFNDLPIRQKRGECAIYSKGWKIDTKIPIFTQDRNYIEKHLRVED